MVSYASRRLLCRRYIDCQSALYFIPHHCLVRRNSVDAELDLGERCQIRSMSFLSRIFGGGNAASVASASTRTVAKDRLSVILASQRGSELLEGVCMEDLQRDVLQVVQVSELRW